MTTRSSPVLRGGAAWRKSSHSGSGPNCVEVTASPAGIHVRDSKNPDGPHLTFTAAEWAAFLTALKKTGHASTNANA